MPEQTYDYLIAPKASFDATADAIRAMTGSQASITWGQDGFADAANNLGVDILQGDAPSGRKVHHGRNHHGCRIQYNSYA